MHQNPNYLLTTLAGQPYLLPFGQSIADHCKGVKINRTGEEIWNQLSAPISKETLLTCLCARYEVTPSERPAFVKEIDSFLRQLIAAGILIEDGTPEETPCVFLSIAGLTLSISGSPETFPEMFEKFYVDASCIHTESVDQRIEICTGQPPVAEGLCLLSHGHLEVYEQPDSYVLFFPASEKLLAARLHKSGGLVRLFLIPPYDTKLREDIFHAIRITFLYLAAKHQMYAIHSASLLYQKKAWLFSGPSGTGKSTHTNLWNRYFKTPVLNGDVNLLAFENDIPVICGIPWCGTSGICDTKTYPLGGIVLLKQDLKNQLYPLDNDTRQLYVMQRIISPRWNSIMLQELSDFIGRICPKIKVLKLGCTATKEAVLCVKEEIDRN